MTFKPFAQDLESPPADVVWEDLTEYRWTCTYNGLEVNCSIDKEAWLGALPTLENNYFAKVVQRHNVDITWALGTPSGVRGVHDIRDVASRVLPTLRPIFPLWPIGFRTYCRMNRGDKQVPWYLWKPTLSSYCQSTKKYRICRYKACFCGYHLLENPWKIYYYLGKFNWPQWTVLVVAPTVGSKYVIHQVGMRVERYDVLAAVVPHEYEATDEELADGRLVRARNLPARAYEIAWALKQFAAKER